MPTLIDIVDLIENDIKERPTEELVKILGEIALEMSNRKIPDTYSKVEVRGGTRPTTQPLNP